MTHDVYLDCFLRDFPASAAESRDLSSLVSELYNDCEIEVQS